MDEPEHPILPTPYLYQVIGLDFQVDPVNWNEATLNLTLIHSRDWKGIGLEVLCGEGAVFSFFAADVEEI